MNYARSSPHARIEVWGLEDDGGRGSSDVFEATDECWRVRDCDCA